MATIDHIKKQYNKLTARERFALMVAADIRGDELEANALADSAPKVNWEFPHTVGLTYGFRQLVKHHIAQQLGTAGTFFMLMYLWQDEASADRLDAVEDFEIPNESMLGLFARRFLEGLEAFRAVCQEYNVDPAAMDDIYNPAPLLTGVMKAVTRLGFADNTELTDLEATKAGYRAIIETSREHWAEAKARPAK